jgi:hypothetical protein
LAPAGKAALASCPATEATQKSHADARHNRLITEGPSATRY